jgi:curved DNA-binding protein CbpA
MAGKNLYEILEVASNATAETLEAAYRVQCERLKARKDPDTARVMRLAADEAYHTLSNAQTRAQYDLKLRQSAIVITQVAAIDDSSWFSRNWAWLVVLAILMGGGGYFYDKNKKERAAAELKAAQDKAALERKGRASGRGSCASRGRCRPRSQARSSARDRVVRAGTCSGQS